MFTSVMNKKTSKRLVHYLGCSLFLFLFDKIYALFSHGVDSIHMQTSFLYPLIGGIVFICLTLLLPSEYERLSFNAFNAGLATLSVAEVIKGIFEIAGTDSVYLPYFTLIGLAWLLFAILSYLIGTHKGKLTP